LVDPALVRAVIEIESQFRDHAVSRSGAVGAMQLMPDTARRYRVADRRDARQNIEGGVAYLKDLLARFEGNVALALAAYNAGEHAVDRQGRVIPRYRETMLYVPQVLDAYLRYRTAEAR
jgi:soluble lytic murein transglycosylase-like protein